MPVANLKLEESKRDCVKWSYPYCMDNEYFFKSELQAETYLKKLLYWQGINYHLDGIIVKQEGDCSYHSLLSRFNGVFYHDLAMDIHFFRFTRQGPPSHNVSDTSNSERGKKRIFSESDVTSIDKTTNR